MLRWQRFSVAAHVARNKDDLKNKCIIFANLNDNCSNFKVF